MALGELIGRWLGRVEIVLAGLDERLRDGEEALAHGDAMRARAAAHAILERLPGSPHGLALLADACEAGGLEAELELTLDELSQRAPSHAEVWMRLAEARRRSGAPAAQTRDAFVRALAVAAPASDPRRGALLALADLDLELGDGARADLWLDRVAEDRAADVCLRRAEARLAAGDGPGAQAWLERAGDDPLSGRLALARGRVWAEAGDDRAIAPLLRAMILGERGASEALSSALASMKTTEELRAKIGRVIEGSEEAASARWRAAFARAEGRREDAKQALIDAVKGGSESAARALFDAGLADGDEDAVIRALEALPAGDPSDEIRDARALCAAAAGTAEALDAIAGIASPRVARIAQHRRAALIATWLPADAAAMWHDLLARLDGHARRLGDLDSVAALAELSADRARPLRIAIVGEFNAGKSTFINALIGEDVAPTGVLPTTATLHHLRYAPDPIARVILEPGAGVPERIVATSELRATLKALGDGVVRRVEILLPIASLTRAEILDTPGFNAPDARHTLAARRAFEEADVAVWLLDASQPFKDTERAVLEDAKRAGLPVQILINKADRLRPTDLAQVVALVARGLAEIDMQSVEPPLAFSAKLALAGRLGDADALAQSGWTAVAKLIDEQLIGRSETLKERSLRRRFSEIVAGMMSAAAKRASAENEARERAEAKRRAFAACAARLDRDGEASTNAVLGRLTGAVAAWRADVALVATGRDHRDASSDAIAMRYAVDRALAHLGGPACEALVALCVEAGTAREQWQPLSRAAIRAAASCEFSAPDRWLRGLSQALVATAIETLGARAIEAHDKGADAGLASELGAFATLLARPAAASPLASDGVVGQ